MPSIWALERAKKLTVSAFLWTGPKTRIVHCLCETRMTGNSTCELHWQIADLLDDATQDLRQTIGGMEMEIAELRSLAPGPVSDLGATQGQPERRESQEKHSVTEGT